MVWNKISKEQYTPVCFFEQEGVETEDEIKEEIEDKQVLNELYPPMEITRMEDRRFFDEEETKKRERYKQRKGRERHLDGDPQTIQRQS